MHTYYTSYTLLIQGDSFNTKLKNILKIQKILFQQSLQ